MYLTRGQMARCKINMGEGNYPETEMIYFGLTRCRLGHGSDLKSQLWDTPTNSSLSLSDKPRWEPEASVNGLDDYIALPSNRRSPRLVCISLGIHPTVPSSIVYNKVLF